MCCFKLQGYLIQFSVCALHPGLFARLIKRCRDHGLPGGGCWFWTGRRNYKGYGLCGNNLAHRSVYSALVGEIPAGMTLDHLCNCRGCVNPDHLEPVTLRENQLRRLRRVNHRHDTHCLRGHEWNEENTLIRRDGYRKCRKCANYLEKRRLQQSKLQV